MSNTPNASPTGRLSTSEPVMQWLSRDGTVRRTCNGRNVDVRPVARELGKDSPLIALDFSELELRTLAYQGN